MKITIVLSSMLFMAGFIGCLGFHGESNREEIMLNKSIRKISLGQLALDHKLAPKSFEVLETDIFELGNEVPSIKNSCWVIKAHDGRMFCVQVSGSYTKDEVILDLERSPKKSTIVCQNIIQQTGERESGQ